EPQPQYPRRGGGGRGMPDGGYAGEMREAPQAGLLGVLPPPNWWHDPQISTAVKLSDSQFTALDAIAKDHTSDIDKLRMGDDGRGARPAPVAHGGQTDGRRHRHRRRTREE